MVLWKFVISVPKEKRKNKKNKGVGKANKSGSLLSWPKHYKKHSLHCMHVPSPATECGSTSRWEILWKKEGKERPVCTPCFLLHFTDLFSTMRH